MRAIDADALKSVIPKTRESAFEDCRECTLLDKEQVQLLIDKQPTLDVVPVVHGRWVKMTGMMPPEYHGHYECSECQWHMKGLRNSWTREEELSYCPNCGAKMDREVMSE